MAVEEKIILKVEQDVRSATTVKELRDALKEARAAMNEAAIGSDEYKRASEAVTNAQNQLANATRLGTKETKSAGDSYNALSRTMAELKQQYHSVTDDMKRKELAKEINAINDRLKNMDSDVGVFVRNVGNYTQGFANAFSALGGGAASVIQPIQGVNTGLQLLSKTPIIAALGIAINLFTSIVGAMRKTEDGSKALSSVMGLLSNVADLVTKAFNWLGKGLGKAAGGVTNLLRKFGLLGEESEKRIGIEKNELALAEERRRVTMENADLENQIAKKRAEAADKLNKSGKESMALTKEAMALEEKKMQNNVNLRRKEYELIQAKNALLPSSSQELQEEADAYAALKQAETDLFNKKREYNAQLFEMSNRSKTEEVKMEQEKAKEIAKIKDNPSLSYEEAEWEEAWEEQFYDQQAMVDAHHAEMRKKNEEASATQLALQKKEFDDAIAKEKAKEALKKHGLEVGMSVMKSATQLVGEETAAGKAMSVAMATIDTYKAANSAYASMAGIPIVGPALGAAAAAAAIVAGIANVKNILAVDAGDKDNVTMANVGSISTQAPAIIQQVPVMRSLTGASEEARMNQIRDNTAQTASAATAPIKAYVVGSEVEGQRLYEAQTEAEASF